MKNRFLIGLLSVLVICTLCLPRDSVDSNVVFSANAHDRIYVVIDAGHAELPNTTDWVQTCRENSI